MTTPASATLTRPLSPRERQHLAMLQAIALITGCMVIELDAIVSAASVDAGAAQ